MVSSRPLRLLFALLLTAGLVGACEQPSTSDVDQSEEGVVRLGSVEAVDSVQRAVAPNERPLIIDGFRGTVDLRGSDEETAALTFVRRGRAESAEAARGVLEDVTITESGSEQEYTYKLEANGGAYAVVDVSGTVPRGTALEVNDMNGPVTLSGIGGALTVTHDHGPVTVRDAAGSVTVETKNGDVDVGLQSVPPGAGVTVRIKNGDVTLRLPPTADATLSAETSAGVIRARGLTLREEAFMPRDAGGEYTAQVGQGGASIDLQTENGSILLQAADTTTEADTTTLSAPPSDTTVAGPPTPDTTTASDPTPAPDTAAQTVPSDTTIEP